MSELLVLARIALRNLFANFLNLVIGGIILVGTLLFVLGGSILNSVDSSMSRSIIGSAAGHIQVYNDKSKEDLSLFGNWTFPDLEAIPDFSKIKGKLESVPNVQRVVPMGVNGAAINYGNTMDQVLEKLRRAVNGREGKADPARIASLKSHVRQIVAVIQGDFGKLKEVASTDAADEQAARDLAKAASPEFWDSFDRDPLGHLEFLENKIAYLLPDSDFTFLSYLGTDLDAFRESFDRMQVVDGEMVPKGKRGILISKYVYENEFKLKIAHRMDKMHEGVNEEGKKLATDPDLKIMIKQNQTQTREILLQLDPIALGQVRGALQKLLNSTEADVGKLLTSFFTVDDANLNERYAFFYKEITPHVDLYRLQPGDTLTIKAFTKSGFIQSANLRIYGTFQFKGLEKSGLAGGMSLMDLMSFRDLYGYVTPEKIAETEALKKSVGSRKIERENAENELFGSSDSVVSTAKELRIDDSKELGVDRKFTPAAALANRVYTQAEIDQGVALDAAIILKDPSKLEQTMKEISDLSKRDGLDLRVVTWQKAAGQIGQFVFVAKAVLYFAVFIIFIVALAVINNAVMMATLQRIREIGTMRAIGAQRTFVLAMVLMETLSLGLVFGLAGTLLGAIAVKWLGVKGIPAGNEFLYFFFSGPRLYVTLGLGSLIGAFVIICVVTSISALYPAIVATRVAPVRAMQTED